MNGNGNDKNDSPPPKRACANCHWYVPADAPMMGNCGFDPPKVQFFPAQIQKGDGGKILKPAANEPQTVQMAMQSYLPPVPADFVCHNHNYVDEPSPAEIVADSLQQTGEALATVAVSLDLLRGDMRSIFLLLKNSPGQGGT
jgi:hypothetical protein